MGPARQAAGINSGQGEKGGGSVTTHPGVFLTELRLTRLNGRWRRLTSDLIYTTYQTPEPETLVIPGGPPLHGFIYDGASVPRIPLAWLLCGDTGEYGAAVHDFVVREGWPWGLSARVFREALYAAPYPEPKWRVEIMYAAVVARGILPYKAMPGVLDPR
ncbi:MAG: DUF1353 domain-containing protein [Deltaproteobacteria bacterium]|nr:DUF1353 domain-containing protein [Deltaproteobacteria bacterium]